MLTFFIGVLSGFCLALPVGAIALMCINKTLQFGIKSGFAIGFSAALADAFYALIAIYSLTTISNIFLQNQEILDTLKERYSLFLQQKDLKQSKEKLKESFDLKASKVYNEGSDKVGEDIQIVRKPKTLKEFLNYGKTSETAN